MFIFVLYFSLPLSLSSYHGSIILIKNFKLLKNVIKLLGEGETTDYYMRKNKQKEETEVKVPLFYYRHKHREKAPHSVTKR